MRDAFICDGIRTPIGRYGGALAGVRADDLAAIPLRELLNRNPKLDASAIDDVIFGCANQAGKITVTWRIWRRCWRAIRTRWRARPSTACAVPVWTQLALPLGRLKPVMRIC